MITSLVRKTENAPLPLRAILALCLSPVVLPLSVLAMSGIAAITVVSAVLTVPILPLYIGKDYSDSRRVDKINPFLIWAYEIMHW